MSGPFSDDDFDHHVAWIGLEYSLHAADKLRKHRDALRTRIARLEVCLAKCVADDGLYFAGREFLSFHVWHESRDLIDEARALLEEKT